MSALRRIEDSSIVAVCDLDEGKARQMAFRNRVPNYYTNFSMMLEKEGLDAVYVLTNPQSHPSLSIQAMEAGCHVLVEKPMAITLKEVDLMMAASRRNNVKLCTSHSFIHTPQCLRQGN